MSSAFLHYSLHHGHLDDWLAAGPYLLPTDVDLAAEAAPAPLEGAEQRAGETKLIWRAVAAGEDHLLDLSAATQTPSRLAAWAYAEVESPAAKETTLTLLASGPVDLWLNDTHVFRNDAVRRHGVGTSEILATLQPGWNRILVRLNSPGAGPIPACVGLHVAGLPAESAVRLPTSLPEPEFRQQLRTLFARAYLDRDVFTSQDEIAVRWPADLTQATLLHLRLQDPGGPIYLELQGRPERGGATRLGRAAQVEDGRYQATLMTLPEDYYIRNLRAQTALPFHVVRGTYSPTYYGTEEARREEALADSAKRKGQLFGELAKLALGQWQQVQPSVLRQAVTRVETDSPSSALDLLGLLHIAYRYSHKSPLDSGMREELVDAILQCSTWPAGPEYAASEEGRAILLLAGELLAGQLYYDRAFAASGRPGDWHRRQAEQTVLAWLHRRAAYGFDAWGSPVQMAELAVALTHLVEFARSTQVQELAAVVLDKLLFSLALNSFRGVYGAPHSHCVTAETKSGRLQATSGISRLLWGMGVFNEQCAAPVSLALAENYELPPLIQNIALDLSLPVWARERHAGADEANSAAYRTADYVLASAQDYRAGQPGDRQHVWQAVLGPDAIVFTNHPACASQSDAYWPNFWRGNGTLPRVAQWKEALVALYRLPPGDLMGFTHAYFPLYAFDEHLLQGGWAFARRGDGYLALAAANGFELITQGENAYRELRSYGQENAWLCQMGQASLDGSFADFQAKMLVLPLELDARSARLRTLRGDSLALAWEGPLQVNGEDQPLSGFKHYDSVYGEADLPAASMLIRHGDQALRLRFDPRASAS